MMESYDIFVKLPLKGKRCGEKMSMWRDDVVVARVTSKAAAEAVKRLLNEPTEVWPHQNVPDAPRDDCYCGDDD